MVCPKCSASMLAGAISIESRLPRALGGAHDAAVHDIVFVEAAGRAPVRPRLEGTAWMCGSCDTLLLVGGW